LAIIKINNKKYKKIFLIKKGNICEK